MAAAAVLTGIVALAPAPARADEDINAWGRPDFEKGDVVKVALWRDDDGWHIRWTTAGHKHRFSGWIGAREGEFTAIRAVRVERGDWARVSPNDKRLVFDTTTDGGVDGFDFRSDGKQFTFKVEVDGEDRPERVFIGKNERNPKGIPFTLDKWESHPRGEGDRERDRDRDRDRGGAAPPAGPGGGMGAVDGPSEDVNAWGKPDFEKGDVVKVALWRDDDGWHIRWTTAGHKHRFSGWIGAAEGEFTAIRAVRQERGDWARVSPNDKRLLFDTETDGGVDGFDFRSDGKRLTFKIEVDGEARTERVFIGRNDRNPSRMPFALDKWESQPRKGKRDRD
jgi:hypothetical protein